MPEFVPDSIDSALLQIVQQDNQTPAHALAVRVGLSESAVLRRLRRLRKQGVIAADVSVVRPAALGLPLTVIALVSLEREGTKAIDGFSRAIRERPEVRRCWYVTGEADFVVLLQLRGMEAYEAFSREIFLANPNVRSFRTIVAMREVVGPMDAQPLSFPEAWSC